MDDKYRVAVAVAVGASRDPRSHGKTEDRDGLQAGITLPGVLPVGH